RRRPVHQPLVQDQCRRVPAGSRRCQALSDCGLPVPEGRSSLRHRSACRRSGVIRPRPETLRELLTFVALLLMIALAATPVAASNRYDPRLRFRVISTPRFDIYFHQGEDALARRLAVIAEEIATKLDATLGPASGRVHVILVDQTDLPN